MDARIWISLVDNTLQIYVSLLRSNVVCTYVVCMYGVNIESLEYVVYM